MAQSPADPAPPRPPRWADLRERFLSALIFGPAAIVMIVLGGAWLVGFVAILGALMTWEWRRLVNGGAIDRRPTYIVWCAAVAALCVAAFVFGPSAGLGATLVLALIALILFWSRGRMGLGVWLAVGLLFIGSACVSFLALRAFPDDGLLIVIWLVAVIAMTDIAAYFAGRSIGGPKLWPKVSPKKTWAGFIGGLAGGAVTSAAALAAAGRPLSASAFMVGAVAAAAGQVGDLGESFAKRRHNVKDASGLIPGHGGVLDRLDSLLAAATVTALAAWAGANIWD